jgi:hypothetical protein
MKFITAIFVLSGNIRYRNTSLTPLDPYEKNYKFFFPKKYNYLHTNRKPLLDCLTKNAILEIFMTDFLVKIIQKQFFFQPQKRPF